MTISRQLEAKSGVDASKNQLHNISIQLTKKVDET
jgi:hypothetical protein